MKKNRRRSNGQNLTESILVLPLFLFAMFMVLQLGEIGVALLVANYAASSVARKAANEASFGTSTVANLTPYEPKVNSLMVAGMTLVDMPAGCIRRDDPTVPTATLDVAVRTKIKAWPFFATLLSGAWKSRYDPKMLLCPDLMDSNSFGPFNFSAQAPYYFYVTGRASARLNYVTQ